MLYECSPIKNKTCNRKKCFLNGGKCTKTLYAKYTIGKIVDDIIDEKVEAYAIENNEKANESTGFN